MIGHVVLFIAALVAAASAALAFPRATASEGCTPRVVLSHSAVETLAVSKAGC